MKYLGKGVIWLVICLVVVLVCIPVTAQRTTLRYLTQVPESYRIWIQENLIPKFEDEYGVRVEVIPTTTAERNDRIILGELSGEPFDLVWMPTGQGRSLGEQGFLLPLNEYVANWADADKMVPDTLWPQAWQGNLYTIGFMLDLRTFLYNKESFEEVGLSSEVTPQGWQDLMDAIRRTTVISSDNVLLRAGLQTPNNSTAIAQDFMWFRLQAGGRLLSDDWRRVLINSPENIEALETFADVWQAMYPTGVARSGGYTVADGTAAMMRAGSHQASRMRAQLENGLLGSFVPRRSPEHEPVSWMSLNGHAISRSSPNADLAFELLKTLMSHESMQAFTAITGYMGPRIDMLEYVRVDSPHMVPWFEALLYARLPDVVPPGLTLDIPIEGIRQVLDGVSPASSVIEEAHRIAEARLNEYWRSQSGGQ